MAGAGRTQDPSRDCAASDPETAAGRHPAPEKAPMICSSSVSGIMENRDRRLAPGFPLTPLFQHQRMWLFSGLLAPLPVWGPHSLYRLSSQQGNRLSPCGPKPPGLHCAPGDSPFPPEHPRNVKSGNFSATTEFLLLGLSEDPQLQPLLFCLFLSMYLVSVFGNLLIILAIVCDSHLHTPMYFFLSNLSFVDICLTSTTIPKMLVNIQTQSKSISYPGCLTQICFVLTFAGLENGILVMMAFDRFVAICHPLRYKAIMNPKLCRLLVLLSFLISVLDALLHTLMALRLSFCTDLEIPHFFCELAHVLKLACSDIFINNILVYLVTSLLGVVPLSGIIISYTQIVSSVLKIPSAGGKYKAFSICGSHLIVVSLFYGTGFGVYLSSAATHSSRKSAIVSVMYTVVTPMMNPFIYSLRNKDMMGALRKLISRISASH
ncbi:olfactory receptor 7G3-like [Prionailurus bengalensis]|uniref:olfactory receptor 7G3-like n=1 Tax=Prionailurus bengalensis TaxID=37029 RepID=UPI001CA8A9AD|nr:olfactory receptor 7G3-like [Prionailurus bengalensis]